MSFELTEQDRADHKIYQKADKAFWSYRKIAERNVDSACDEAYRYGGVPPWAEEELERSQARAGLALTKALKSLAEAQGMTLSEFFESERVICPTEAVNVVTDYLNLLKARREELQELEHRMESLRYSIEGWEAF